MNLFRRPERRANPAARSHYDGIAAFKGYMRRIFKSGHYPYDWADLNHRERSGYARRAASIRERRSASRA